MDLFDDGPEGAAEGGNAPEFSVSEISGAVKRAQPTASSRPSCADCCARSVAPAATSSYTVRVSAAADSSDE